MKKMYLIRHAKSSWNYEFLTDFDRPLDQEGHENARQMSIFFSEKVEKVDLIISSTAQRAITTASYFADALKIDDSKIQKEISLYHTTPEEILDLVQHLDENINTICIFGHNPTLSDFAQILMNEKVLFHEIPTCGMVEINFNGATWKNINFESMVLENYFFPEEILA
jgi:phosphohistidine phosphatase